MEKYAITIRETISRTIIVEAEDLAETFCRDVIANIENKGEKL